MVSDTKKGRCSLLINQQEQRPLLYLPDRCRLMYRFRHRSLFSLYSRPCMTNLAELFLPAVTHFSEFSVQRHRNLKVASMKFLNFWLFFDLFPEILLHLPGNLAFVGREYVQIRLLYRILCRPTHKIDCCTSFFPSSKDDKSSKNPFCTEFLPPNASIIQSRQPAAGRMPQSCGCGSLQPRDCHS